jgi:hypothetical protein
VRLLGLEAQNVVLDMLAADTGGVADPQAGAEKHLVDQPLDASVGIGGLKCFQIRVRERLVTVLFLVEIVLLRRLEALDELAGICPEDRIRLARRRVSYLLFGRPFEHMGDCRQPRVGHVNRLSAGVHAVLDDDAVDAQDVSRTVGHGELFQHRPARSLR